MESIRNLSHDQPRLLHHQGQIRLLANKALSVHICSTDKRVSKAYGFLPNSLSWACLLLMVAGPISIFFLKWYWGMLIFFSGAVLTPLVQKLSAEAVMDAVLENETLYHDCLGANVVVIKRKP